MRMFLPLLLLFLTGCAAMTRTSTSSLPTPSTQPALRDLGPAPELTNTTWLNTHSPLRLADLRGQGGIARNVDL